MSESVSNLATCVLLVNQKDELFMLRRQNTNWMNGKWSIPGGMVEQGETIHEAAVREVVEETGAQIRKDDCEFMRVTHTVRSQQDITSFYFVCRKWNGEPINFEEHKASESGWFSLDSLPSDSIPHTFELARDVQKHQSGVFETRRETS